MDLLAVSVIKAHFVSLRVQLFLGWFVAVLDTFHLMNLFKRLIQNS